jgi:prepilin-type N-terminal cleavage/methylation domain-containing protein
MNRRRAFTLVELMAAVLILALLSTAAALSFSHPLAAARLADACRELQRFDASARELGRATGKPVRMMLSLSDDVLIRRQGGGSADAARVPMPAGVHLAELRIGGESFTAGEVEVDASPVGWTRTYAVRLVGHSGERWMLFAGVSGQATRVSDVRELDATEAQANGRTAPRHDAD